MNIGLIGYGKMGQAIEPILRARQHNIAFIINNKNKDTTVNALPKADVVIEFTTPESAYDNVALCLKAGIPVVSGSTGWHDKLPAIEALCQSKNGSMLITTNCSLGVNLFMMINEYAARLFNHHHDYHIRISEIHHTQKKDAPSGTAITLAEKILKLHTRYSSWSAVPQSDCLQIESQRIDNVPGIHEVTYNNDIDNIKLTHTAHNRQGFALGAVVAAEFIGDKKGIFSMYDVLQSQFL